MVKFDSPEFINMEKIEKVIFIDKKIEESDKVEADIQFKLDLLNDYRTRLMNERTKHLN